MNDVPAPAAALIDLLRFCENTERRRSPVEAAVERTNRVLTLETAWALRRVGDAPTSSALAGPALAELMSGDAVEKCVALMFETRLKEAPFALASGEWPLTVTEPWQRLELFLRYKVDRLISISQVLAPWSAPNPYREFAPRGVVAVEPVRRQVLRLHECSEIAARIKRLPDLKLPAIEDTSRLLRAAAPHGLDCVLAGTEPLKAAWPTVTDGYNTNSHWCVSAVAVFDAMAFAIAEAVNPLPGPPNAPPATTGSQ